MIRQLAPAEYVDALNFLTREDSRTTMLFQLLIDLGKAPDDAWACLATTAPPAREPTGVLLIHKPSGWWLVHGRESAWWWMPNLTELNGFALSRLQGEARPVELLLRRRPVAERRLDRWFDEAYYECGTADLKATPDPGARRATSADVRQLEQHDRLYFLERGAGGRTDWPGVIATGRAYVVERHGKIVASLRQYAENYRRCEFGGLFTLPAYRGKGVAAGLMAAFCRDVFPKAKNAALYVDPANLGAVRACEKAGFKPKGAVKIVYFR